MTERDSHFLFWVCVGALAVLCLLTACRSARPLTTEVIRADSATTHRVDSTVKSVADSVRRVAIRWDSVWVNTDTREYARGETVYVERTTEKVSERLRRDTLLAVRRDTVTRFLTDTVTVYRTELVDRPVEVEKRLTGWRAMKDKFGGWAFAACAVFFVYEIRRAV